MADAKLNEIQELSREQMAQVEGGDDSPCGCTWNCGCDSRYLRMLEELIHIDLEYSWKRHSSDSDGTMAAGAAETQQQPPRVEFYLDRFRDVEQPQILERLLKQEFFVRNLYGDQPGEDEFRRRFPHVTFEHGEPDCDEPPEDSAVAPPQQRRSLVSDPDVSLEDSECLPRAFGEYELLEGSNQVTHDGELIGTPAYMSPEQAVDSSAATTMSDVYSIGATLYHLLTGRPPFQADTALETVRQVIDADPIPPVKLNPRVGRDLETICLKCLQKNAASRYPSAADLADDLKRYLDGEPILARATGRSERFIRWLRRNPATAGASAAALVFLCAALVAASVGYVKTTAALRQAEHNLQLARDTVDELYSEENLVLSGGLGIETPTGSDARAQIGWTDYTLKNEAVLLQPFLGLLAVPDDRSFVHAFAQIDAAANGNTVLFSDATVVPGTPPSGSYGRLNDQTLLYLDLSSGYWLHRNSASSAGLTGVAVLGELHYTTTLQDGDLVTGARSLPLAGVSTATVSSRGGQLDVVNLTTGLQFEWWHDTVFRVAGSLPLRGSQDRFFDAELLVQLTRRL